MSEWCLPPILYGSLLRNNKKEDFVPVLVAQAK